MTESLNALRILASQVSVPSSEPITRVVHSVLRRAIEHGELLPGRSLSEKEVSEMFRVPRQPVREAFIKLVEADLLHVRPQRGTYIKPISMSRLREALFVREAVECAVIRLAAEQVTMKQ